jgi:hypothetical protein
MNGVGKIRSSLAVILLTIVTLGIYGLYWQYASFKELKQYSGEGIGGGLGLVLAIFISIVNIFLLPMEVGQLYKREGRPEPVSALTGLWILLPLVGWFIWLVKVQGRLNDFWSAHSTTVPTPASPPSTV